MKSQLSLTLVLVLIVTLTTQYIPIKVKAAGTIYYVSQSIGSDNNSGLSSSSPWKTLAKVSSQVFKPGDQILLKKGDTWTGENLIPKGTGTASNFITLASYGTGNRPIIKDPASYSDPILTPKNTPDPRTGIKLAIRLADIGGWKIKDIEISNAEYAIIATNYSKPDIDSLWFENLYIHDITGGRMFTQQELGSPTRPTLSKTYALIVIGGNNEYKNVTIKNCTIKHVVTAIWTHNVSDLQIDGCDIYDSQTGGVDLTAVSGGVMKNSKIERVGYPDGIFHGITAIMFGQCRDFTVQDCEISDVIRGASCTNDGYAIDYEGMNTNITTLRCTLHDTDDAAFLIFNEGGPYTSKVNNANRIIGNNVYNCGRLDPEKNPILFRQYGNTVGNGVASGNNIKKMTAKQKVNYTFTGSGFVNVDKTDNMPIRYYAVNNTVYSTSDKFPTNSLKNATSQASWKASSGFDSTQGGKHWYQFAKKGSTYTKMTYDSKNSKWVGGSASVGKNWQTPSTSSDSARRWVSTRAGVLTLSGKAKLESAKGSDGVKITVLKNNKVIYGPTTVKNTTGVDVKLTNITVDVGDSINFVVNKNSTATSDKLIWDPTIKLAEKNSWTASKDFTTANGNNQWAYMQFDGTEQIYLNYDSDIRAWSGIYSSNELGSNYQIPEGSYESQRRWIAPKDGNIKIISSAKMTVAGQEGSYVRITKNGTYFFGLKHRPLENLHKSVLINSTSAKAINVDSVNVKSGDVIYFRVKAAGISNSKIIWGPTITYTSSK